MRLHRLAVRDYKAITHREVLFPDSGILVVEGPNEVGKSTLLDALDLVLDFKDSSRRARIREAQPIGRDVGPHVEVELSSGPYRFVYRKQWLRHCATELDILTPRREHLVGDVAHERVRALLAQTADLHLWKALRLMQADPLVPGEFASSSALAAALDTASGTAADAGGAGETLLAAAEAAYLRFFTPRNGQPTGEYRGAIERVEAARRAVAAAQEEVAAVAHDVEQHGQLAADLSRLTQGIAEASVREQEQADELSHLRQVAEGLSEALRRRDEAAAVLDRARERHSERVDAAAEIVAVTQGIDAAQALRDELRGRLTPADDELAAADAEHERAAAALEATRDEFDRASAALARRRDEHEAHALRRRLRGVREARAELAVAHAGLETDTVTTAALREIEAAAQAVDLAAAAHVAGSAAIVLRAVGGDRSIVVDGQVVDVPDGQAWESPIAEPTQIAIPGLFDVELRPEAGARPRAAAVADARDALADLLVAAGCASVSQARACHDRRHEHERQRAGAQSRLRALLDGDDHETLLGRLERLEAARARLGAPADEVPAGDPPGDTSHLEAAVGRARAAQAQARTELDAAHTRRQALRAGVEQLRLEATRAEEHVASLQRQVQDLRGRLDAARAARPDAELDGALASAGAALRAADEQLADRTARLADHDLEALRELHRAVEAEVVALRARRREVEEELIRVQARLDQAGGQGRSEAYDAARTQLEHAVRAHERLRRHAEAAKLLRDTLTSHSQAAKASYVRPFGDAVARLGRIVYGASFEVEVDDALRITARVLEGRRIPYEALSTGAKEQLAIITRLACATLVDADNGVPVVIDDALGYSDPDKLRRVCAAVGRLRGQAQVVLLTCTPGRYAAIPQAEVVRL